jgi:hypothetical protein
MLLSENAAADIADVDRSFLVVSVQNCTRTIAPVGHWFVLHPWIKLDRLGYTGNDASVIRFRRHRGKL